MRINRIARDITVLADEMEVPGIGHLPVNAFVLHATEPVVVDTGLSLPGRGFMDALGSVVDVEDIEWIWLTHPDRDHTGSLFDLLDAAPNARVVTTFAGVGIMSTERPLPMNRVYLLNPGQSLDVGDRRLTAFRPPLFDNPSTVGFYDESSEACFTSDCFGAPMPSADLAIADDVGYSSPNDVRAAQHLWASVDSPWVQVVDETKFLATVSALAALQPRWLLSTHLPPAHERTTEFLAMLASAPHADPFIGPDQAALEQLLASFEPA
ncbi:MBL fold metallo-hydrolase [Antrihabitans stalactiti]|uniref:MBL fold metallo-hydrolase n=1 Tax=Antrihabitans stalactiti TaxID=2584121 RepID=A0A848KMN8_9NOCA|nr:MBL fold metallo-hydrolase [Antrihabitans stalactiti]NMN98224.1 MBL fold metallo-hydrolase [Antrihabitans stalactiti]